MRPWADIPRKRAPGHLRRVLTKEELSAVFHVAQGEARTLFLVGTFAGLRLGDARRLDWRQVDVERGALVVTPHKTRGTSGREAVIPLHPELAAELARVPPEQRQGFVMPKMATATANHVNEIVRRIFAAAGIKTQAHVAGYRNAAVDIAPKTALPATWTFTP